MNQHTSIVFAVVVYHQHHLPLEDIGIDKAAADAWNVFVSLHLLKLATEEAGRRTRRRHSGLSDRPRRLVGLAMKRKGCTVGTLV